MLRLLETEFSAWVLSGLLGGLLCSAVHAGSHDTAAPSAQLRWKARALEVGGPTGNRWDLTLSPYTYHWRPSHEHRPVLLAALDRHGAEKRFYGMALFTNSFGQASSYIYVGQQWDALFGQPQLFSKISAGLLYGYHGERKDKVPLNENGIAPAVIPSIGYAIAPRHAVQVFVLGTAGLLFSYAYRF